MQITIKLFGVLRAERFSKANREYPASSKVFEIVEDLQVPSHLLGIVLVNDTHAGAETILRDGDTLTLLPVVGGG